MANFPNLVPICSPFCHWMRAHISVYLCRLQDIIFNHLELNMIKFLMIMNQMTTTKPKRKQTITDEDDKLDARQISFDVNREVCNILKSTALNLE